VGVTLRRRALHAARYPRRTVRESVVLRDLISFRARYSSAFRSAKPGSETRTTVLIVSLSDFVYQLKLEGILGKALQLAGCRVVALTHTWSRWGEPYFRAFGIDEFVHPEDFVDDLAAHEVDEAVAHALSGEVRVQALRRFVFRGANVGEQTLSTLSRRFERGRISLSDPSVRVALEDGLRDSIRSVVAAERLLDELDPDVVLFNEKNYTGFGSIYDLALKRNANVIQFVMSGIHWRDALVFKRFTEDTRRVHPTSLAGPSWQQVRDLPWTEQRERELRDEFALRYGGEDLHPDAGLQAGKQLKPADAVRTQLGLDRSRKTVVVFSHVLWDANMFFGEDLFEDQETWLVETVRAACANDAVNWIVKLHPANRYKSGAADLNDAVAIREALGELPPHVRLLWPETDINTYSLFAVTDVGVTIRGTIGMELPVFGIPVLTAGTGRYSGLGFTIDSKTADEYRARLLHAHEISPLDEEAVLLAKRHAYALFRMRPFRFTTYRSHFMPPDRLHHPLSHNLEPTVRTAREVEEARDLRAFGEWALGGELDYLREPT
jgi:hypothetical protein